LAALLRRGRVALDVRLPHVVPVAIQLSIYLYWSIYWPGVAEHAPSIVLQIALAYAVEAWLSFLRFGAWRVGLGPLPVVLSANLFAWFDPLGSIIVVCVAMGSKTLLRYRGRHLFNPSAAGLVAGGLYLWLSPGSTWDGLFHTQNLAPNLVEVVLALSVVPLLRFGLGLIPLGGVMAMLLLPLSGPSVTQPGMIIALALFASDPATTPKTQPGRLLYGLFVGTAVLVASTLLSSHGHPDDFAKVLPVPIANVLAPAFDTLVERYRWLVPSRLLAPRWNVAFVALWLLIVLGRHVGYKPAQFEAALHWTYGTPLVVRDGDDIPRCANNPIFCHAFSFAGELEAWSSRRARR
jgi:hypothetical protein